MSAAETRPMVKARKVRNCMMELFGGEGCRRSKNSRRGCGCWSELSCGGEDRF